jgi:hypothetical protein
LEKKRAEQVLPVRGSLGVQISQTIYTLISKYKNDKIKGEKIIKFLFCL